MPESKQRSARTRRPASAEARQERKFRVLTKDKSSVTRSISDAVVIKAESLYFLCEQNGDVPLGGTHGFGFYYHDCRYIHGYELRLAGTKPTSLVATAGEGF